MVTVMCSYPMPLPRAWPRTPAISSPAADGPVTAAAQPMWEETPGALWVHPSGEGGREKVASVVSLKPQEECDLEWVVPRGPATRGWHLSKSLIIVTEVQARGGSRNG